MYTTTACVRLKHLDIVHCDMRAMVLNRKLKPYAQYMHIIIIIHVARREYIELYDIIRFEFTSKLTTPLFSMYSVLTSRIYPLM